MGALKKLILNFNKGIIILCLFILYSCGGSSGTSTPKSEEKVEGQNFNEEVQVINFDARGNAEISFQDVSQESQFAIVLFSSNPEGGEFELKLNSESELPNLKLNNISQSKSNELYGYNENKDMTGNFHEKLRQAEEKLSSLPSLPDANSQNKNLKVSQLNASPKISCANDTGIIVNVLSSFDDTDSYDETCAIKVKTTDHTVYYVDEEALSVMDDQLLQKTIDDFESKIPLERGILGEESDVNHDGHFAVYFTSAVNRLGGSSGGFVTGYFFGGDLYPIDEMAHSNEMEIFYINVPDPQGNWGTSIQKDFWESNLGPTVLTHEYQHMISFNYKVLQNSSTVETGWANEGLSHLMEDLRPSTELNRTSEENPSRVQLFLSAVDRADFTQGTSLEQRGGTYLFLRYLYEQANLGRFPELKDGKTLLKQLVQSADRGIPNIESATGQSFKDLLLNFYVAVQLSNTQATSSQRYNFQGICLTCEQDDHRGTVLHGVNSEDWPDAAEMESLSSPGGLFFQIDGRQILSTGESLKVKADPNMDPAGGVFRIK